MEDHLRRKEPRRHRQLIQSTPLPDSNPMVRRLEEESMVSPDSPGRLQKCSPMGECQNQREQELERVATNESRPHLQILY